MDERTFSQLIYDNKQIQTFILDSLELEKANFYKETTYINGITSDFTIAYENKILAIVECKRADIGVTDYVRGIGQLFQYEYFYENNITPKKFYSFSYDKNFKNILIIPSDFIKNTYINIGRFKYPETSSIVEINIYNNYARKITQKELKELEIIQDDSIKILSQYYIRDNRLFELYIALRYLRREGSLDFDSILNRKNIESKLKKVNTINNGNWRNAFISLSTLGFINNKNQLTSSGLIMSNKSYEEFIVEMYNSYIKLYVDEIMQIFKIENKDTINLNNIEFCSYIRKIYNDKDILFLTQSDGRYISSWLSILRDDFGCLDFVPRKSIRTLKYYPADLNLKAMERIVKDNSKAYYYINKFIYLMKQGEI